MVGVRGPRAELLLPEHEAIGPEHSVETVSPKGELLAKVLTAKLKQLTATGLGKVVRRAYVLAIQHNARYQYRLLGYFLHMLVESLSCYAKQLTQGTHLIGTLLLCQECNYLASEFFLIGMAYFSSAISIIRS